MLFGPVFGAAADRWSRKRCLVVSDLLRAVAFLGIALVDDFASTVALAALAGVGTGLFTPAALAALPTLVKKEALPAMTSIYGAVADVGFTAGPALAAAALALGGADAILVANALTFALSAFVLAGISFGAVPETSRASPTASLLTQARAGLNEIVRMRGIRVVIAASAVGLFFGGLFNVAELLFATGDLHSGQSGFSVLATIYGLGFVFGSLTGSKGGSQRQLKRGFLLGLAVLGFGYLLCGLAPTFWVALPTFGLAGFGNGVLLVYERLLVQTSVPDGLMARVFGAKDALTAWAFAVAFLTAGVIIEELGTRPLILLSGAGSLLAWVISALSLRRVWGEDAGGTGRGLDEAQAEAAGLDRDAGALRSGPARQHSPDLVSRGEHWLPVLDDLGKGDDDDGIELRPGVGH